MKKYFQLLAAISSLIASSYGLLEFYGKRTSSFSHESGSSLCLLQITNPYTIDGNFGIDLEITNFKPLSKEEKKRMADVEIWLLPTVDSRDDMGLESISWTEECDDRRRDSICGLSRKSLKDTW